MHVLQLYMVILYICKNIFIWNTHHTTNVQLCGQLKQTMILFDTSQALPWMVHEIITSKQIWAWAGYPRAGL